MKRDTRSIHNQHESMLRNSLKSEGDSWKSYKEIIENRQDIETDKEIVLILQETAKEELKKAIENGLLKI